jgi:hypothetical protein
VAAVLQFARHYLASDLSGPSRIRQGEMLRPAKQHVASCAPLHPRAEAPNAIEENDAATVICTALNERRANRYGTEADNAR